MIVLKIMIKLLVVPVIVVLTVIQWIGIFLNSISVVITGILSFIFALTGIASLALGLVPSHESLKMIAAGFMFFMIPVTGEGFVMLIAAANARLCIFLRS